MYPWDQRVCLWLVLGCCGLGSPFLLSAETEQGSSPPIATEEVLADLWTRRHGVDWPRFLGPTRDGKSPETGVTAPWPASGPRVVWQRPVGSGYGIGSVSRGRYYHFDREEEGGGKPAGAARLRCLHAETGEELWQFRYATNYHDQLEYSDGPRASPVIDGNRVYIFGAEGSLLCVRASDGKLIWQVDTSAKFHVVQNFFGVGSTPVILGSLLICQIGGSPPGSPGLYDSGGRIAGNGSGIVAFDKWTGAVRYEITDELASYASIQVADIRGRLWCFAFARGGLVGFDPANGQVDFQYPWRARMLESVNASTPVVVGNEVFISEAYQVGSSLLSVQPGSCEVVWRDDPRRRDKSLATHWNTPIFVDGYLYGCSGRHTQDAELRCIEWKKGRICWSETGARPERSSLLFADGYFMSLGEFGTLQLLRANPQRYELVSSVVLRDESGDPLLRYPCWAAPILAHGLLYIRGENRVVCLELIPSRGDRR